jgi:hypothetical protein
MLNNRRWIIINVSDVTDEMLSNSIEGTILRKSLDDTKTILKWDGDTPSCFDGMTTYNHSEILTILSGPEWNSED